MKYNLFIGSRSSNDGRRHSVPKNVSATNFINKSSMEGLIIPIGIISASSQLTASLDNRYVVCGTVEIDSYLDNFIFITSGSFTSTNGGY